MQNTLIAHSCKVRGFQRGARANVVAAERPGNCRAAGGLFQGPRSCCCSRWEQHMLLAVKSKLSFHKEKEWFFLLLAAWLVYSFPSEQILRFSLPTRML